MKGLRLKRDPIETLRACKRLREKYANDPAVLELVELLSDTALDVLNTFSALVKEGASEPKK